jgi:hypothetical protein
MRADRAHQQLLETARAARADHDHIRVRRLPEDYLGWRAGSGQHRDRRGPGPGADLSERVVRLLLGFLTGVLGQVLVHIGGVANRAVPEPGHGLPDGEHGERRVADRGLGDGPLQGVAGMAGAVDADDDSWHLALLLMLTCFYAVDARQPAGR